MSDWKPGTVAKATVRGVPDVTVFAFAADTWASGEKVDGTRVHDARLVTDVRPLVVLDPRDEAVEAFMRKHTDGSPGNPTCTFSVPVARLIEAQAQPPRIPEPGYGAIVSSLGVTGSERMHWVRGHKGWTNLDATGAYLNWTSWDALRDPVLAREGVES